MALTIDDDNTGNNNTVPTTPAPSAAAQQAQPQAADLLRPAADITPRTATAKDNMNTQNFSTRFPSLKSLAERNASPLAATPDAASMKTFLETIKQIEPELNGEFKITVLSLGKAEHKVFASGVVLVVQLSAQPNAGLAFHTLIMADTTVAPPSVPAQINGRNVEVLRVVGDAYDEKYKRAIGTLVGRSFPNVAADRQFDAEAEVLPAGYNYKDVGLVRATLVNALKAAGTVLNMEQPTFQDLSLGANASAVSTTARVSFNQPQSTNSVGEPVRTDVRIDYIDNTNVDATGQATYKGGELRSLNSDSTEELVFSLGGYMSLEWNPVTPQEQHNPWTAAYQAPGVTQNTPTQLYSARLVITHIDAPVLNTLPSLLLGLATTLTLRDNRNWIGAFWQPHQVGMNFHDIGAIGIEAGVGADPAVPGAIPGAVGKRIDTRSDQFKPANLAQLISAFVRPEISISLDVPEVGPDTWLTSVFLAAARGDARANQYIIDAANLLTNGQFGRHFAAGAPCVLNDQNRIHLGTYTDANGVQRDIRDVDHLSVLNLEGENNPGAARDWSDSFNMVEYPLELRLDARRRIIENLAKGATFTGFAQRITFSGAFLQALASAVVATGLNIRPVTPFQDLGGQPRAGASYLEAGSLTAGQPVFNRGGFATPTAGGFQGGHSFGRWK